MSVLTYVNDAFTKQCHPALQLLRSYIVGGTTTAAVCWLGNTVKRLILKQPFDKFMTSSPVIANALRVTSLQLPSWYLVDRYVTKHLPNFIKPIRYELASLATTGALYGVVRPELTPKLGIIVLATHLFWRAVGWTDFGGKVLGLSKTPTA